MRAEIGIRNVQAHGAEPFRWPAERVCQALPRADQRPQGVSGQPQARAPRTDAVLISKSHCSRMSDALSD